MQTKDLIPYTPLPVNGFAFTDHNGIMWLWDPVQERVFCIEAELERLIEVERPTENGYDAYTLLDAINKVRETI